MIITKHDANTGGAQALVKGSPEGLAPLLAARPAGYERVYRAMAENGMRVLALARRRLTAEEQAPICCYCY